MKKIVFIAAIVLGVASFAGAQGDHKMTTHKPAAGHMMSSHKSHHMTSHKHASKMHKHKAMHHKAKHHASTMTSHAPTTPPKKHK